MEIIGQAASEGVSVAQLQSMCTELKSKGVAAEVIDLTTLVSQQVPEAAILVVRGGVNALCRGDAAAEATILAELQSMPKDTTIYSRKHGRVVNKIARHNNCIADFDQAADIANGKGTVVNFCNHPQINLLRSEITELLRKHASLTTPLVGELNHCMPRRDRTYPVRVVRVS